MDALQKAINEMSTVFEKKMEQFEGELQKGTPSSLNIPNISSEFASFKGCVVEALKSLQSQLDLLMQSVDHLEMRSRRKILLLHGIPEKYQEDVAVLVKNVICEKLRIASFQTGDISRCHRIGKPSANKPRPILFKLKDMTTRSKVWMAKKQLKGTGITLSEFLTKVRHDLFMAARQRYGITNCWTYDGTVYVQSAEGKRHPIRRLGDLDGINSVTDKAVAVASATEPVTAYVTAAATSTKEPTKTRRKVTKK